MAVVLRPTWVRLGVPFVVALLLLLIGCTAEPPPVDVAVDEVLGLEAVAVDDGSLSGTFALKSVAATVVKFPGLPDELGGEVGYRLQRRTYLGDGVYRQTSRLCGGHHYVVHGVNIVIDERAYRAVPLSEEVVSVDHARGTFAFADHVETWGIALDDPVRDAFPATEEDARAHGLLDDDDDGEEGVTVRLSGTVEGEVYTVLRKRSDGSGLILDDGVVLGLQDVRHEQTDLGASNALVAAAGGGNPEPYPDASESWFEEVRVDDDTTCDDVMRLEAEGVLSRIRPF